MLKKKVNGAWDYLSFVKKKDNGSWADCDTVNKKINGAWSIVWQRIFTDWVFGDTTNPYGYSTYSAESTANGNIQIKAQNSTYSGNYLRICTNANITMEANETLYLDYVITKEGFDSFWDFDMRLATYSGGASTVYAYSDVAHSGSGTISMTRTSSSVSVPLNLFLSSQVGSGQYASATVDISKIYTDSKVYYWGTKSIVTS